LGLCHQHAIEWIIGERQIACGNSMFEAKTKMAAGSPAAEVASVWL
jgi:hypothetical protein